MPDYDLSYKFTIKSVSIYMDKIDILNFAKHHYGCVIRTGGKFRCTYYDDYITMNMYKSGSFIVFTYSLSDEELKEHIYKIFGRHYKSAKLTNISIRFNFPDNVILGEIEKRLIYMSVDDIFMKKENYKEGESDIIDGMTKCYVNHFILSTDKFPGIRIKIWKDKKIKLVAFSSGKINCMGIKNKKDIELVKKYLGDVFFPMLEECKLTDDDLNINFDDLL